MSRQSRALVYPTSDGMSAADHARLHSRYEVDETSGCWNWTGTLSSGGYPIISIGGHYYQAHRLLHDLSFGPTPKTWDVDHLCRNKVCVSPAHTEATPHCENVRRAYDPTFNPGRAFA